MSQRFNSSGSGQDRQKTLVFDHPPHRIVYQKTVPTDEERIVVEPCLYFDVYKEKIIATTPPNQHTPIEGRAVVETLSTLDEVRQMIKNATPAVEMFETHRPGAYEDDRVFLLYPSEVMDGMQRAIIPFLASSGGYLVRELSIMRTRYVAGGGMMKEDRAITWWLPTVDRYSLQIDGCPYYLFSQSIADIDANPEKFPAGRNPSLLSQIKEESRIDMFMTVDPDWDPTLPSVQAMELLDIMKKKEQITDEAEKRAFWVTSIALLIDKHTRPGRPPISLAPLGLQLVKTGHIELDRETVRCLIREMDEHVLKLLGGVRLPSDADTRLNAVDSLA